MSKRKISEVAWVPGALDNTTDCIKNGKSNKYDTVIICLGAVIRGSTSHYDYVCSEVSKGIAQISLNNAIQVMFGVLTTDTLNKP